MFRFLLTAVSRVELTTQMILFMIAVRREMASEVPVRRLSLP